MKKNLIFQIILCSLLFGCNKEYDINNTFNKIFILGHAGMGIGHVPYPPNSLESVVAAKSLGADGSELDIQMTLDSVLVCYHDHSLEEATNLSGEIYSKKWDEIKDAEYKSTPLEGYKISKLDNAFKINGGSGYLFTMDIKLLDPDTNNRAVFQRAIIRLIEKYNMEFQVTIESTDLHFLKTLKSKKPDLQLFMYSDFEKAFAGANTNGFAGITVRADEVTSDQISLAQQAGLLVAVFSATSRNHDETINKNPDIIQSDDVANLVARLK